MFVSGSIFLASLIFAWKVGLLDNAPALLAGIGLGSNGLLILPNISDGEKCFLFAMTSDQGLQVQGKENV